MATKNYHRISKASPFLSVFLQVSERRQFLQQLATLDGTNLPQVQPSYDVSFHHLTPHQQYD